MRHEAVGDAAPVRVELDRRDREHEQCETAVAEDPLDPVEGRDQDDHGERGDAEDDQDAVGKSQSS